MPADHRMTITGTGTGAISVAGEVDAHSAPLLAKRLVGAGDNAATVEVDLSEVTFIDSSGLQVLVDMHERSLTGGPAFVIRRPSKPVRRLLELAGLSDRFVIVPG